MLKLLPFLQVTVFILFAALLTFKPKPVIKIIGIVYWNIGKFTALGKSENTKKYFIGKNTFWFRALGVMMLIIGIISLLAQISE
ncbi:MAG: hypothetical protein ABIK92_04990 [Pseudomonadota bacterium]